MSRNLTQLPFSNKEIGVRAPWVVLMGKCTIMEKYFNSNTTSTVYQHRFTVALNNFERYVHEERLHRRLERARQKRKI